MGYSDEKVDFTYGNDKILIIAYTRYTFYDGPPFATGLPHYGHILAGTVKDIVTRYAHQNGYHVERRFGWDCHGLPVEYEIDKTLGIKGPEDVAKMGIKAYNDKCREIVMRYSKEWEEVVGRVGRWIGESSISLLERILINFNFRFQERLQNPLSMVHGIHLVGIQAIVHQRISLSRS